MSHDHGRPRTKGDPSPGKADDAVEDLKSRFAHNVIRARRQRKLSLRQLAARAGVSTREVQHIEAGGRNVTLATIARLAVALDRDPREMFVRLKLSPVELLRRRGRPPGIPPPDLKGEELKPGIIERRSARAANALRVDIATNVAQWKQKRGLTLKQISARAGLHWRHVQKVMTAETNITAATIARLAVGLRVEPLELLRPRAG